MRITELTIFNNYLFNVGRNREALATIQSQISTLRKIQKPSDSPEGTGKLIRLQNQLRTSERYSKNIFEGLSFFDVTVTSMETIQTSTANVLTTLANANNAVVADNLQTFADQIDAALDAILNSANQKFNGKYLFAGTDYSTSPFDYNADGSAIEIKVSDISGKQNIQISRNIIQKINMTGAEIFGTIVKQSGNLDSSAPIGDVQTNQTSVYSADGTEYTFIATYTKTADNTYKLSYDIQDSGGSSVFSSPPASHQIVFDPLTGEMNTINGKPASTIIIEAPSQNIQFIFDPSKIKESANSTSLSFSANQKVDIFNTLLTIKNKLENGELPTDEEVARVTNFNKHILNKLANAGNIINKLQDTKDVLSNQQFVLTGLISDEQDVDIAKAILELQNQDYILQLSYKISSMVLPKSLLDYI
ncbi:MAG: flagellar hook-associated protein FlgL [Bacteroidetes bacterium]|nr:flagellar hook-associated protein FlgL [Bacteroidota bacterium]